MKGERVTERSEEVGEGGVVEGSVGAAVCEPWRPCSPH